MLSNARLRQVTAFQLLALAVFGLLAAVALVYTLTKTRDASGAIDFHSYWYSGLFIRQGTDPFGAYLQGLTPSLPIWFAGKGIVTQGPLAQPGLANVPANTAPLVLLLAPFAFLFWEAAKSVWLLVNLVLVGLIPLLVFRLLPAGRHLSLVNKLALGLAFAGLFGTRNIVGNGQTSLLVFALMLAALALMDQHEWLAGLALGVALSKYSIALPVLLIVLLRGKLRLVFAAALVQIVGVLAVSMLTGTAPQVIVLEYYQIFQVHTGLPGIHLASLFPQPGLPAGAPEMALSLLAWGGLAAWWARHHSQVKPDTPAARLAWLHAANILVLWTLLIAYHRAYDTFMVILFYALALQALEQPALYRLSGRARTLLLAGAGLSALVLTLPARGLFFITTALSSEALQTWLDLQGRGMTLMLIVLLVGSLWLLFHLKPIPDLADIQT